jgi:hypothetical protein
MNTNNIGLLPKIWGPPLWDSLHSITFAFPEKPTNEEITNYKTFFESVGNVLPCCYCSKSYNEFIKKGETELSDKVFKNRKTLTRWLYVLHNNINKKLGMTYDISYKKLCEKHETYRAKCNMTPEEKALAYQNFSVKDMPIISYKYAECFNEYAKSRGITDFNMVLVQTSLIDHETQEWQKRNINVNQIVKFMRINGITGIEKHGQYKGLLTLHELELIKRMSTTLTKSELEQVLKNLNIDIIDTFEFTK